jgi:hypothetical protein
MPKSVTRPKEPVAKVIKKICITGESAVIFKTGSLTRGQFVNWAVTRGRVKKYIRESSNRVKTKVRATI